jgi:hypothetical protein
MRFSITTLLILTLLVSAYFPLQNMFEPWQQARIASQHPLYALRLDNAKLRNGDTIVKASSIFPTMQFVEPYSQLRINLEQAMGTMGEKYPEGVDLYRHNSHGVLGILAFQNGKLIMNNDNGNPVAIAQQRLITPSLWFRSGILPMYTIIASILLAAWVIVCKWFQSLTESTIRSGHRTSMLDS